MDMTVRPNCRYGSPGGRIDFRDKEIPNAKSRRGPEKGLPIRTAGNQNSRPWQDEGTWPFWA
jgi:hypothetical protein